MTWFPLNNEISVCNLNLRNFKGNGNRAIDAFDTAKLTVLQSEHFLLCFEGIKPTIMADCTFQMHFHPKFLCNNHTFFLHFTLYEFKIATLKTVTNYI